MSEQCLFLQRNRSRGKPGCSFHSREKEECVSNEILVGSLSWLHSQLNNLAIEDLLKKSRDLSGCPYYASRRAIPYLEIVLLPYNLLLNEKSREALGMDLKVCLEAAFHRRTRWCCSTRHTTSSLHSARSTVRASPRRCCPCPSRSSARTTSATRTGCRRSRTPSSSTSSPSCSPSSSFSPRRPPRWARSPCCRPTSSSSSSTSRA